MELNIFFLYDKLLQRYCLYDEVVEVEIVIDITLDDEVELEELYIVMASQLIRTEHLLQYDVDELITEAEVHLACENLQHTEVETEVNTHLTEVIELVDDEVERLIIQAQYDELDVNDETEVLLMLMFDDEVEVSAETDAEEVTEMDDYEQLVVYLERNNVMLEVEVDDEALLELDVIEVDGDDDTVVGDEMRLHIEVDEVGVDIQTVLGLVLDDTDVNEFYL